MPFTLRRHRAYAFVALVLLPLAISGCRAVTLAYGPDIASARANADALLSAIEQRFTHPARTPKFANARMRVARYSFAPGKLANDTALWTSMRSVRSGADRELEIAATMINGQFTFSALPNVPVPVRTGDERHLIRLTQLNNADDWQWDTSVDHAVGSMPPGRATDVARALFLAGERPAATVRADYRTAFPRTTTALGRLFTIDSLTTTAQSDGSMLVGMQIAVSADNLKSSFPAFAKFVAKYVEPARYRYRLSDRAGGDWFDVQQADRKLSIRFRTHGGELQPLVGVARRMPDTLALNVDVLEKISFFTVGVTGLQGEFVHVHTPSERSWAMRFTKEPSWHLPLVGERLLRAPLRRPFEGRGIDFRFGFRTGAEGQTLLSRTFNVAVRESAIMRFLGNLGFTAMADYAATDAEESRFVAEAFAAMRADIRAQ